MDKLKTMVKDVKCDLHKIGNMIYQHDHKHKICNNGEHQHTSQGTQTDLVDDNHIDTTSSTTDENGIYK